MVVELRAIGDEDVAEVAEFLHINLNERVAVEAWLQALMPPWDRDGHPNHGYYLATPEGVVGAYVAIYSVRVVQGSLRKFCNLAAFCVAEEYRAHGLRLLRALIAQRGFVFTDFSPSGNVLRLNERLGFKHLDTSTKLVPNLPCLPKSGIQVTSDPLQLSLALDGPAMEVYLDHRDARAARHVLVRSHDTYAYTIIRRDRRKGLPIFATPIFCAGDLSLLESTWPQFRSFLLTRHGAILTLAEARVLGFEPSIGLRLKNPRPKMYKTSAMSPDEIDYLYSELALLEW